jgi:type IV secretory pathway TrbD component
MRNSADKTMPTLREWLTFWGENVRQSYKAASDHGNIVAFIGPIIMAIVGVAGTSAFTQNKWIAACGAGFGVVAWFLFLMLFVTPARLAARRDFIVSAPDVTLEGTYPGAFVLHARGHACEIRTGPIVSKSIILKSLPPIQIGEFVSNVRSQRFEIGFPVVSALHDGDEEVIPFVFAGNGPIRSRMPNGGAEDGMTMFFRNAKAIHLSEIGSPDPSKATEAEWSTFYERSRQPITFEFDITFWNIEHTHPWTRHQRLVFEPLSDTVFVHPVGLPKPLLGPSVDTAT